MISVLIQARGGQEEALARTLGSLVPAAVEGVVREVVVIGADDAPGVAAVSDHAGCRTAERWADAIAMARADWLLLLEPGARLVEGWSESVVAHASASQRPARFRRDASAWQRLRVWLCGPRRRLSCGLLVTRVAAAGASPKNGDASDLARRLPRPATLSARIVPAA